MNSHRWTRRTFLQAGALASVPLALPGGGQAIAEAASAQSATTAAAPGPRKAALLAPADFAKQLRGPLVSIPTPFDRDYRVDVAGVRRLIDRALDQRITQFTLTAGDGQFDSLSYDEIRQLSRDVVDAVGGRGLVTVATGPWWTSRAVEFAKFAESIGASALQVMRPARADDEGVFAHFSAVAAATRLPIVMHGVFALPLLERLVTIPSIAALKEDSTLKYTIETTTRFAGRLNCYAGGSLQAFLVGQPYGATAYFDAYATFAPEISRRFWSAVSAGRQAEQVEIVKKYDMPFISGFSAAFWHATLEYFGVAARYLRPPQRSYTDAQMAQVREFYDRLDLRPPSGPDGAGRTR